MTFNDKGMPPHAYKQQGCDKSPNTLVTPLLLNILSNFFLIPQSKIVNHKLFSVLQSKIINCKSLS